MVLELVGDVAWTREVVEFEHASFAEQDDTLDEFVERYRPTRVAMDQTGWARSRSRTLSAATGRNGSRAC